MRPRMRPHGNFGWGAACDDVQAPHIENRRFGWEESAQRSTGRSHPPRLHAAGISLSVLASFIRRDPLSGSIGFALMAISSQTTSRLSTLGWRTPAVIVLCGCLISLL